MRRPRTTGAVKVRLQRPLERPPKMDSQQAGKAVLTMQEKDLGIDDGCGWAVAGILTELEAAVLTPGTGDGAIAGTMELVGPFATAANEPHFSGASGAEPLTGER